MMEDKISVIIPVYKVEQYLHRCINSVINQTYKNLEIILVDDGSPDNSGEICEELAQKDSRIKVYHKDNGGLSDARNYGTGKSNGDYITFIDSDDYIAPNYLEYLYNLLRKNNADISCCCMQVTEDDTTEFSVNHSIPAEQLLTGCEACVGLLGELYMVLVTACGKLYKSDIVKKYPFPVGKKHEDEATTCKYYYESEKVVIGNQCLYAYYQNGSSITHTKGSKLNLDAIWALEHRANFFEENNEIILAQYAWNRLFYYYIGDSKEYNGRCDKYLKDFGKNKNLSKKILFELKLYNTSHRLFKCYYQIKTWGRGIKNRKKVNIKEE